MTTWSLFAVGAAAALAFTHEARADERVPARWVGMDGRTYLVPTAPPDAEEGGATRSLDKHGRPRRRVNVGMAVAGGIFTGLGTLAFFGGIAGYFATIDCNSSSGFLPSVSCTDKKEILLVSLGGAVSAAAIGTPLLVVGLRRPPKNAPIAPADEASLSLSIGPVSGLTLAF